MHRSTLVLCLLASPLWAEAPAGLLPYTDATAIENGQAIYDTHCAACHGIDLAGEENWRDRDADGYLPAPPHDETGHTWHHPDTQLFMITKHGTAAIVGQGYKSNMMGFDDLLTDQDILEVLAYIKSTWPNRVIDTHNRINQDAKGPTD